MVDSALPLHQLSPTLHRSSPRIRTSPRKLSSPRSSPLSYAPLGRQMYMAFFWIASLVGLFLFIGVVFQPSVTPSDGGSLLLPRNSSLSFSFNDMARIIEATKVTFLTVPTDDGSSGDVLYDDEIDWNPAEYDDDSNDGEGYSSEEDSAEHGESSDEYEDDLIDIPVTDHWMPVVSKKAIMQLRQNLEEASK